MGYPVQLLYHVVGHTAGFPKPVPANKISPELIASLQRPRAEPPMVRSNGIEQPGRDPVIAFVDSGITGHPCIRPSVANSAGKVADRDLDQWDLSGPVLPAFLAHATFGAGIARQYAPEARLRFRRVTGSAGVGHDWTVADAILGLIPKTEGELGPDVLNISLGPGEHKGGATSWPRTSAPRTRYAIRALQDACGTIVVVSAGPKVADRSPDSLLAERSDRTVFVGASDGGAPAWFSADDNYVDLYAPGQDVLSTFVHWTGPVGTASSCDECAGGAPVAPEISPPGNFEGWAEWSGTSFAAPVISGLVASELGARAATEGLDTVSEQRWEALNRVRQRAGDKKMVTDPPRLSPDAARSTAAAIELIPSGANGRAERTAQHRGDGG